MKVQLSASRSPPPISEENPLSRDDFTSKSLLHRLLTGPLILERRGIRAPVFILMAIIAILPAWLFAGFRSAAILMGALLFLIDMLLLLFLPITRRSWGPVMPPLTALTLLRAAITTTFFLLTQNAATFLTLNGLTQLSITLVAFYGLYLESARITVTRRKMQHPAFRELRRPLRLLQLSDLHFEERGIREEKLLRLIEELKADLIVFTGDFINLSRSEDRTTWAAINAYLGEWEAKLGIYVISGTPLVETEEAINAFIEGLPIRWLRDEKIQLPLTGGELAVIGVTCTHDRLIDAGRAEALIANLEEDAFNLLIYHSPDIVEAIADSRVNLMLCGHTHGGQIRLPVIGPLVTSSAQGRCFVMGSYPLKWGEMYVSRGIGMEGAAAPRARLLCPPEIILWELHGN